MNIQKKEPEFTLGHYKGRWVWIPLLYAPAESAKTPYGLQQFSFIPLAEEPIKDFLPYYNCDLAYKKIVDSIWKTIDPEKLSDKEVKQLARTNDIPLHWLTKRFPIRHYASHNVRKSKLRKNKAISSSDFSKLKKVIKKIHPKLAVALEVVKYHNDLLGEAGGYVTLGEVLRAKLSDLHSGLGTQSLSLSRSGKSVTHLTSIWMPRSLWKKLSSILDEESLYIFSTDKNIPLTTSQANVYIARAAKAAKLSTTVTSLSFRPAVNILAEEDSYGGIIAEKWDEICREIPELLQRKGRKSKYDLRIMLNAILYFHVKKASTIRGLPKEFPPYRAVHSQLRRWEKNEVLKKMLKILNLENFI